jgi:hypothetical protein
MWNLRLLNCVLIVVACASIFTGAGCDKSERQAKAKTDAKGEKGKSETTHSTWWCEEHGVPEEMCSICMSEAAARRKYKDNGDWCKEHNRAQSQCFKCDPTLYVKYEEMYVAKYGKKPERPPEAEFKK